MYMNVSLSSSHYISRLMWYGQAVTVCVDMVCHLLAVPLVKLVCHYQMCHWIAPANKSVALTHVHKPVGMLYIMPIADHEPFTISLKSMELYSINLSTSFITPSHATSYRIQTVCNHMFETVLWTLTITVKVLLSSFKWSLQSSSYSSRPGLQWPIFSYVCCLGVPLPSTPYLGR